jgi:hypothetical protein
MAAILSSLSLYGGNRKMKLPLLHESKIHAHEGHFENSCRSTIGRISGDCNSLHLDASLVIPTRVLRFEVSWRVRIPSPPTRPPVLALWLNPGTPTVLWWTAANPANSVQPICQSHSWLGRHVVPARPWFCGSNQEIVPDSSCFSCHHAAYTWSRSATGSIEPSLLVSPLLGGHTGNTFRARSWPAPTQMKPQPAPAILGQQSVHTTLSITHHAKERPSTGRRMLRSSSSRVILVFTSEVNRATTKELEFFYIYFIPICKFIRPFWNLLSHPFFWRKLNASHMCARIRISHIWHTNECNITRHCSKHIENVYSLLLHSQR